MEEAKSNIEKLVDNEIENKLLFNNFHGYYLNYLRRSYGQVLQGLSYEAYTQGKMDSMT